MGTTASLLANAPFRSTTKGNRIYLFLTDWPRGALMLPGLRTPIRSASLLAQPDQHPVVMAPAGGGQALMLPPAAPDPICSVVALDFDRPPEVGQ